MLKLGNATAVMGAERAAGLYGGGRGGLAFSGGSSNGYAIRDDGLLGDPGAGGGTPRGLGATDDGSGGRRIGSIAIWSGGSIAIGTRDATTQRDRLSVSTGGLSAGADLKLADDLVIGAGGGYGGDRTKIGTNDTARVDSDSWVGAIYGSYAPANGAFVDWVGGAGRLTFDTSRLVGATNTLAVGHRAGAMVFGSLALGYDRTTEAFTLSTYGRLNLLSASLDRYGEDGAGIYDLAFGQRRLNSLSSTLGTRAGIALGAWTPSARFEWRHEFDAIDGQPLDYADVSGYAYRVQDDGWLRDSLSLQLGIDHAAIGGWRIGIDLGGELGSGARAATGQLRVAKRF